MTHKFTEEELENARKAQKEAEILLHDKEKFDKVYDEVFTKYDKNKDGHIDVLEYMDFLGDMLAKSGRKAYNFPTTLLNFERADKDKNGNIEKEEFKKEFTKRLKDFVNNKI